MQAKFIIFKKDYEGASGETYVKDIKYKITSIKDNDIYFCKDKVSISLRNTLYTIGDIVTNN